MWLFQWIILKMSFWFFREKIGILLDPIEVNFSLNPKLIGPFNIVDEISYYFEVFELDLEQDKEYKTIYNLIKTTPLKMQKYQ